VPSGVNAAKFDLSFTLRAHHEASGAAAGIDGTLGFSVDLFDEDTARQLAQRLARVLAAVAADPRTRIGEIDVLDPAERLPAASGVERHRAAAAAGHDRRAVRRPGQPGRRIGGGQCRPAGR